MTRRGAILFELLVALAIFAGAAALTLSVVGNSVAALGRLHDRQLAMDAARSKMAELEAGLININDLLDAPLESIGSIDLYDFNAGPPVSGLGSWRVEASTEVAPWRGLTLVEIRIYTSSEATAPAATLRRLVRLRDALVEEYREDEMLEGLPAPSPTGAGRGSGGGGRR